MTSETPERVRPAERFWIGSTGVLELEHIGRLVIVDLFSDAPFGHTQDSRQLEQMSFAGRLAGFTESRGKATYGLDEIGYQGGRVTEYPDLSMHSDKFTVHIILEDGRTFTIRDEDYAHIYIPEVKVDA